VRHIVKKKTPRFWSKVGVWSFGAGMAIALLVAIFSSGLETWSIGALAVLGLIVGLLNITDAEIKLYLLASIAFLLSASAMIEVFSSLGVAFRVLLTFMESVIVFVAPGAFLVSFKALYDVAKDE